MNRKPRCPGSEVNWDLPLREKREPVMGTEYAAAHCMGQRFRRTGKPSSMRNSAAGGEAWDKPSRRCE